MGTLAVLYPGQGSQKVGMGTDLRATYPELFERYFGVADDVSGLPVSRLCLEGPIEDLTRTDVAQPALFAHGLALAEVARARDIEPSHVAGHSLGEYTAAVAAGTLSVEHGMRAVCERGRLMAAIQSERPGTMAAIIGLGAEGLADLCARASERGPVSIANYNTPTQLVVSGEAAAVDRVVELAPEAGADRAIRLPVGAAFHSVLMEPVQERLGGFIAEFDWHDARVPMVANFSGREITDAADIHAALLAQIASPVRWVDCVRTLVAAGCDATLELGPGRVLSGLVRQIDRSVSTTAVDSPAKLAAFAV